MRWDGFARCYLEALAYWIGGHAVLRVVESIAAKLDWLPNPLGLTLGDRLAQIFNPVFLVASGLMIVPLLAALLIGDRRSSGPRMTNRLQTDHMTRFSFIVTPAKAGVHLTNSAGGGMDSGLHRNDEELVAALGVEI